MDVEYMLKDTVEVLRPKLKLFQSYDEAVTAAEEIDKEFRAKLGKYFHRLLDVGCLESYEILIFASQQCCYVTTLNFAH